MEKTVYTLAQSRELIESWPLGKTVYVKDNNGTVRLKKVAKMLVFTSDVTQTKKTKTKSACVQIADQDECFENDTCNWRFKDSKCVTKSKAGAKGGLKWDASSDISKLSPELCKMQGYITLPQLKAVAKQIKVSQTGTKDKILSKIFAKLGTTCEVSSSSSEGTPKKQKAVKKAKSPKKVDLSAFNTKVADYAEFSEEFMEKLNQEIMSILSTKKTKPEKVDMFKTSVVDVADVDLDEDDINMFLTEFEKLF